MSLLTNLNNIQPSTVSLGRCGLKQSYFKIKLKYQKATIAPYASDVEIEAYDFTLLYDPSVISITGVSEAGTLSEDWNVTHDASMPGQLVITANGNSTLADDGEILLNLTTNLTTTTRVTTTLTFGEVTVNDGDLFVIPQPGILAIEEIEVVPPDNMLYLPLVTKR